MMSQLTETDLHKRRTQRELRAWIDRIHRQFVSTCEGRRALRLAQGPCVKRFLEEAWPLALFADAFYRSRDDVLFQLVLGSGADDALIVAAFDGRIVERLQITQSFDGYQHRLRMLHLEKYGRAPVTGPALQKDKATEAQVRET